VSAGGRVVNVGCVISILPTMIKRKKNGCKDVVSCQDGKGQVFFQKRANHTLLSINYFMPFVLNVYIWYIVSRRKEFKKAVWSEADWESQQQQQVVAVGWWIRMKDRTTQMS